MQIAVLSDLHLGAKNPLDRFGRHAQAEQRLMRVLTRLERAVDHIVLLGDIFETLRGRTPGPSADELQNAMTAYPRIADRAVNHPTYQLVQGNHDAITEKRHGTPEVHTVKADGVSIVLFHGHQLDWLARGQAPVGRFGIWLGGMLERAGLPITSLVDPHGALPHDSNSAELAKAAATVGKQMGADIVVNGHTHRAAHVEQQDLLYLNSGACVAGRCEFLLLDTKSHRYQVLHET